MGPNHVHQVEAQRLDLASVQLQRHLELPQPLLDALVKEVSIGVPPAEVFEKIPGMTQQRLNRIVKAWSASDPTALQTEYMRKALTQLASSRRAEVAGDASDPAAG